MKIISVGFPKTGTKSASEALRHGFRNNFPIIYGLTRIIIGNKTKEFLDTTFAMFLILRIRELSKTGLNLSMGNVLLKMSSKHIISITMVCVKVYFKTIIL